MGDKDGYISPTHCYEMYGKCYIGHTYALPNHHNVTSLILLSESLVFWNSFHLHSNSFPPCSRPAHGKESVFMFYCWKRFVDRNSCGGVGGWRFTYVSSASLRAILSCSTLFFSSFSSRSTLVPSTPEWHRIEGGSPSTVIHIRCISICCVEFSFVSTA